MNVTTKTLSSIILPIQKLKQNIPNPVYATDGSAGMDLYAAVDEPVTIEPFTYELIPSGIAIALPEGYEAQIRPRSGLALKHGVTVLNAPGTVDSDYRGEIKIILINMAKKKFKIEPQMRIAQMIIAGYTRATITETTDLNETLRGNKGFGSTGT